MSFFNRVAFCVMALSLQASIAQDIVPIPQTSHEMRVQCMAISSSRRLIATGASDRKVILWDSVQHSKVAEFRLHNEGVSALAFSPDEMRLYSASDDLITTWDVVSGNVIREFTVQEKGKYKYVACLAANSKGDQIVTGGWNGDATIWDSSSWTPVARLAGHEGFVDAVAVSPDDKYVVTASHETGKPASLRIWNPNTGRLDDTFFLPTTNILVMQFSGDHVLLLGCMEGTVIEADLEKRLSKTLFKEASPVRSIDCTADGSGIAVGCAKGQISLWTKDKENWKNRLKANEPDGEAVTGVALTKDGEEFVSPSERGGIQFCSAITGRVEKAYRPSQGFVNCVDITEDGRLMAICTQEAPYKIGRTVKKSLLLWNLVDSSMLQRVPIECWSITDVSLSGDGKRVAVAASSSVRVLETEDGKEIANRPMTEGSVWAVDLDPKGESVAYGTMAGVLGLADVSSSSDKSIERKLSGSVGAVSLAENGQLLVGHYRAHDVRCYEPDHLSVAPSANFDVQNGAPKAISCSGDGNRVAVGTVTEGTFVFDANTASLLAGFPERHEYVSVSDVFFLANGNLVGIYDGYEQLNVYDVARRTLVFRICFVDAGKTWLMITPDGHFDGPTDALQWVVFRDKAKLQLASRETGMATYHKSHLLQAILKQYDSIATSK